MPKVTLVGAGSAVFARQIITDILAVEGLDRGVFALVDIDPVRLDLARRIAERLVELTGKDWTGEASRERLNLLKGTGDVVKPNQGAGLQNHRHDSDLPLKDGRHQSLG